METTLNGFDEFWRIYPRHVAKQAAFRAYKKALKESRPEVILEVARRYANERAGKNVEFTKHPATWLNSERWCDYQQQSVAVAAAPKNESAAVYVPFERREEWDQYGRSIGKTFPRDSKGGWWFPSSKPPQQSAGAK